MARIARVVVPDLPHHFTQRGNRREPVFFEADDYRPYHRLAAAPRRCAGNTSLGLLSDAQSRPLGVRRRTRMGRGRSLPRRAGTIPRRSASVPMDGPSVPGVALAQW